MTKVSPRHLLSIGLIGLFFFSCEPSDTLNETTHRVQTTQTQGTPIPSDSVQNPQTKPAGKPILTPARTPKTNPTQLHTRAAGAPIVTKASPPSQLSPGQDSTPLPATVSALHSPVNAQKPAFFNAKDMVNKEQNPTNFSYFTKLQGLTHNAIRCMREDQAGNIWLGTDGGGATRYDGKFFAHFTDKQGLVNNTVLSIFEDSQGNLWFGTSRGVSKYDGHTFTSFTQEEGLANNAVFAIAEDDNGHIWLGTYGGGASRYDGTSFTHFTQQNGLANDFIYDIHKDQKGALWFATNQGISHYDGTTFSTYTEQEGLANNFVYCIFENSAGELWFGTFGGGVTRFDGTSFSTLTLQQGLAKDFVMGICEDRDKTMWFATSSGGISRYDGATFTEFNEENGLSNNIVSCVIEDQTGLLWFGTYGGGLTRYDGNQFTHFTQKDGLPATEVLSVLEDSKEQLWLGTLGGGLARYDGSTFSYYTDQEGLANNNIFDIHEDSQGNIWLATEGGLVLFDGNTFANFTVEEGLINIVVNCISEDQFGNLWLGTRGGVSKFDGIQFTNFTSENGLPANNVLSILEDREGNIWFATSEGVSRYDGHQFTTFTESDGLAGNLAISLAEDNDGNIWIGTSGGGVSCFDGNTLLNFTEKEGLSSNFVLSLWASESGTIWLGTRFGISKLTDSRRIELLEKTNNASLQPSDIFFKNYTYEDGFLGMGCNRNSIFESKSGILWIGANDRLTAYHPPMGGDLPDTIPPTLKLTSLDLYNELIDWPAFLSQKDTNLVLENGVIVGDFEFDSLSKWHNLPEPLSLAYDNNFLTFNFIGITLNQPKRVKYQYRLEGLEKNWNALTSLTTAPYGNLPHGHYTFLVKGMNSEGYWSEALAYPFTIRPPWWLTWWAKILYALATISSVVLIVWWNGRRLRARAQELEEEVDKATLVIRKQKEVVESEKQKSDDLLLNILPEEVAEELKEKGAAEAKLIDEVTVLFTDFKGFTQLSEILTAKELVNEINECFSAFDKIMEKYQVEKIKTIGDAYMAAGGLPTPNATHATDVINAALEIQQFMAEHKAQKEAAGELYFEIRIGVHTGPVVAGIVGIKKFQYDIWGDTVNTASRMESSGEVGKVNISATTYNWIKDQYNCDYRGKISAKGKGEIEMYFVQKKQD